MLPEREMITEGQKKSMWAQSRRLDIAKENLYAIIFRVSGGDSMRNLTKAQANQVLIEISRYKDKARTDTGGREETKTLRRKIFRLTGELGWNNDRNRIDGFVQKTFGIERIEWLSVKECLKLIEILKKMVARKGK